MQREFKTGDRVKLIKDPGITKYSIGSVLVLGNPINETSFNIEGDEIGCSINKAWLEHVDEEDLVLEPKIPSPVGISDSLIFQKFELKGYLKPFFDDDYLEEVVNEIWKAQEASNASSNV